jgi:hypothetical protein
MDIDASLRFLKSGGVIPYSEWDGLTRHTDLTYGNLIELQSVLIDYKMPSVEKNALQDRLARRVQSGDYTIEVREPDTSVDYGSGEETEEDDEED